MQWPLRKSTESERQSIFRPVKWNHDKCERHIHMGGMINAETVWSIIQRQQAFHVAKSLEHVQDRLICSTEFRDFQTFLSKFEILDEVTWDEKAISLACWQICSNASKAGTKCIDVSFSIEKYARSGLWSYDGVVCFICDTYAEYARQVSIEVGPFLSISYHAPIASQLAVANLIDNPIVADKVIGLDLVGDERFYNSEFYGPILEKWNKAGKITRAHVAELPNTASNLTSLLNRPKTQWPTRIAHGIQGKPDDLRKAIDVNIIFDLALYSNMATGAVDLIRNHPLPHMVDLGCLVTLNTDDPVQFGCTLDDEFNLALYHGLIDQDIASKIQENALLSLR